MHSLEGIARLDRMLITFEDPKIVKKTKLALSDDALTLLYYLLAKFLNLELSQEEKEEFDTIEDLMTEEFREKNIAKLVKLGLEA